MGQFSVRELGPRTWPDFARVVEKHNGVWGGCWCTAFHVEEGAWSGRHRELKENLVMAGRTHNALVYEGDDVVGWCLFGPPAEIPNRMTGYRKLGIDPPDWRIPCFFVDRDSRKKGIAKAALVGALRIIAAKGGWDGGCISSLPPRKTLRKFLPLGRDRIDVRPGRIPRDWSSWHVQGSNAKNGSQPKGLHLVARTFILPSRVQS